MKPPLALPDDFAESQRGAVGSADLPHPVPPERVEEGSRPTFLAPYLLADTATWINWLLRLVVGGAFVFAGALKIADPAKFAIAVSNYRLVPDDLINLMAVLLPGVEVMAGLFVLAGIWLRAAALVITSLTVVFAVVIGSALARGLNIDCGCFGTLGGKHIGLANLAIDTALFCLAASLAWRAGACPGRSKFSVKPVRRNLRPRLRLH
ncbi:MAG: putative methylamine utilization protein MauE [Pedosphaera sp.]|nr:putative methylamine utilization protein MauE [Pedosphaera sp.]